MLVTRDPSNTLGKGSKRSLKVGFRQALVTKTILPTPAGKNKKSSINFNPKVGRKGIKP